MATFPGLMSAVRAATRVVGFELARIDPTVSARDTEIVGKVSRYTMTSFARIVELLDAVRYVVDERIAGDILECGVWRGGSMMAVALALTDAGATERHLYLCDTFEGMTEPDELDRPIVGRMAARLRLGWGRAAAGSVRAGLEEVRRNMWSTEYPRERIHLIAGRVEETIPSRVPAQLAVVRLDTDWYSSTKWELEQLWDRLTPGGVLIVDDYGHWAGAKRAVDEFLAGCPRPKPFMHRIDYTGRLAIKGRG